MNAQSSLPSTSPTAEAVALRSQLIKRLIAEDALEQPCRKDTTPRRIIVQFWDDKCSIPSDVAECMNSWEKLNTLNFEYRLYNDVSAAAFIADHFTSRYNRAFAQCMHPAMRADYFRLCFVLQVGGLYVDADDIYQGRDLGPLYQNSALQLQPLCYDIKTNSMVDALHAAKGDEDERIFYVNNNPLIAPAGNGIVAAALERATASLLASDSQHRDVQAVTGPGNLTAALETHVADVKRQNRPMEFHLLEDWETFAVSQWPLGYRSDERNWRNWTHHDEGRSE